MTGISLQSRALAGSRVTALLLLSLVVLFLWWNLHRSGGVNIIVWLLQSLPLMVFLPGIIMQQRRVYIWLCFILLLYFVKAIEGALASIASINEFLFLTLTIATFLMAMFTCKWLQRL